MELWIRNSFFALLVTSVLSKSLRHSRTENGTESILETGESCMCDWRLLRHYEAKLCQPVMEDECGCPEKFNCPMDNEIEINQKVCIYKGTEYEIGSRINTTNVCQICKCLGRRKPRVFCMTRECPPMENDPREKCHHVYEKNSCCPIGYECDVQRTEAELKEDVFTCEYEGTHYPLGAKIYPKDDPCQICECTEDWNGTSNDNCYQQDCVLERNKVELDAGCIPIYHENRCCPIEFYCPLDYDINSSNITQQKDQLTTGSECVFDGKVHKVGEELSINHPTKCVKCTCMVPPDFTCVHQSCPEPHDLKDCFPYYSPDQCCPQYECLLGDDGSISASSETVLDKREMEEDEVEDENPCSDIKCNEDAKCMLYLVTCGNTTCPPVPTCLKINNECSTPLCGAGCAVVEQDENNCPTCVCGENIDKYDSVLKCQMPLCVGQNCHLVAGNGGCPTCSCDEPCAINECPPGYNVLSEVEGRCPQCVCEDENVGCPTPICENESCRIESPSGGCPTCICDNNGTTESPLQQVQHGNEQQQFEDKLDPVGHVLDESKEVFDDIQLFSAHEENERNPEDNELNSESNLESSIRMFSESGERQP